MEQHYGIRRAADTAQLLHFRDYAKTYRRRHDQRLGEGVGTDAGGGREFSAKGEKYRYWEGTCGTGIGELDMNVFRVENNCLKFHYDAEELWIEPWGKNSFRVRASKMAAMPEENWALQEIPEGTKPRVTIEGEYAEIINGKIRARISTYGKLTFYNQKDDILLDEYLRNRLDVFADYCSALEVEAREFKPIPGGDYHLSLRFVSNTGEKIYGMGQYQQPNLNLKGSDLELAQRNYQASIPFAVSAQR